MANQGGFQAPGAPSRATNFPENFQIYTFDGFAGLNTKPTRPAIQDQEMSYCDNFMPLGPSNLRALYDVGTAIFTAASGLSVPFFNFANIADTPVCMIVQSDGSIVQVNTSTLASSTIAGTGTIISPNAAVGVSQWGSQYILVTAPQTNGYFIWDGTLFYQAGTLGPAVNLTNTGFDYTSQPKITAIGGHGSGAAFTSVLGSGGSITSIALSAPGTGYTATDYVTLAFSSGGSGGQTATAIANVSGGIVTSITLTSGLGTAGGLGYNGTTLVSIRGGGGFGATALAVVTSSNASISSVTVNAGGQGYSSSPTVVFADPNNPVAQANVPIMPFGVQGSCLETFTSRVWLGNGAAPVTPPPKSLVNFGAPGSPSDFSAADGAGSFVSTDSFLRVGIHSLKQSNGFLYLIGDSSVNYISGVTTSGNPPVTTFSNQNVDPQIGSPWPNSVQVYGRSVVFANTFGVHAMYGGAVQKVSTPLDGIYTTVASAGVIPSLGGITPSGAVAIINGIHVYMLLLPIIDPRTQLQRNALLCWDGTKWWTAGPSVVLKFIASQEINSVLTAYGTDGTSIYPLFNTASSNITKAVKSKLWDTPHYLYQKHSVTVRGLLQSTTQPLTSFTLSVDTENGSTPFTGNNTLVATWQNSFGQPAVWVNNLGQNAVWQVTGVSNFLNPIDATGVLMGLTLTTTTPDLVVISLAIDNQQYQAQT